MFALHLGDCLEVMRGMDADSVDACVTDPPYGLEFMGKEWDYAWQVVDPFYELLLESRQVSQHIICLPSCNLEMNKYLVNAVKNLPAVTIDVDYSKNWGGKKKACVMFLDIDCTIYV